jgi:hypothetical protein
VLRQRLTTRQRSRVAEADPAAPVPLYVCVSVPEMVFSLTQSMAPAGRGSLNYRRCTIIIPVYGPGGQGIVARDQVGLDRDRAVDLQLARGEHGRRPVRVEVARTAG